MKIKLTACLLTLLLTTGCAQLRVGAPQVMSANVAEIEPYMSTRADVRALLGPPLRTHQSGVVTLEVHKRVTPTEFRCVFVSYRGDKVMAVSEAK